MCNPSEIVETFGRDLHSRFQFPTWEVESIIITINNTNFNPNPANKTTNCNHSYIYGNYNSTWQWENWDVKLQVANIGSKHSTTVTEQLF